MKPRPIKAILGQSDLSTILFCQAQVIKKLKAEIAQLQVDSARKDKLLLDLQRHAEGIVKAWTNGVISEKHVVK